MARGWLWTLALALLVAGCGDDGGIGPDGGDDMDAARDGGMTDDDGGMPDGDGGLDDGDTPDDASTGCTLCDKNRAMCSDAGIRIEDCTCSDVCPAANACAETASTCGDLAGCVLECVDGGFDAGPGDGGPADGGPGMDAAMDGGPDATVPDGGMDAAMPDGGPDGGMPTVALEDFPAEYASQLCDNIRDCFGTTWGDFLAGPSCASDLAATYEDSLLPRWEAAIADGTLTYDPAAAASCLSTLASRDCDGLTTTRWREVCADAFQGSQTMGESCTWLIECEAGTTCTYSSDSCPGTCTERESAGASCTANYQCQDGLYCTATSGSSGTCAEPAPVGSSCGGGTGTLCNFPALCFGSSADMTGTCASVPGNMTVGSGDTCDAFSSSPDLCREGLYCAAQNTDGTSFACESGASSGGACAAASPGQCPLGEYCAITTDASNGTCTPLPTDGESCRMRGEACAGGHTCISGTCRELRRLGEACSTGEDAECYSGVCDPSNVCAQPGLCPF